ncbi:MAG: ATP-dependent Clp protease adaptor protein ClpS [Bacteroidetes bacterium 38_7]|nr:MAG: ATP-dependent Clp protease adaptor protein ClpS [Bacteroidetes bacterium 38_7]HAL64607.1 Clp protease ClpS [Bacteroidales bacterium]
MGKTKEKTITQEVTGTIDVKDLILFNDDVNTFDYVIGCLVEICGHTYEQAEQCATVAHLKGKCSIKIGTYEELKPLCDELTRLKLTVSIK